VCSPWRITSAPDLGTCLVTGIFKVSGHHHPAEHH
jgi:hypothetical protein